MTARLTCWSNSRSEEKTWFHGSGWKILVELNTSKISDSSFSRLSFLVWDRVSCTGLVYPSKMWIVILSSATVLESRRIRNWKSSTVWFAFSGQPVCPLYFVKYACYRKFRDMALWPDNHGPYGLRHVLKVLQDAYLHMIMELG